MRGLRAVFGTATTTRSEPGAGRGAAESGGRAASDRAPASSPGRAGSEATVQVPTSSLTDARLVFAPRVDGAPDPDEVVWTWVPYEENDGRGKDRPVVIVARDTQRSVFALQLTSKPHDDDARHFVYLGSGPWDAQGRPSWARLDRVFRVFESGMRREASSVSRAQYSAVSAALQSRRSARARPREARAPGE
jgi:hypothetical protein